MTITPVGLNPAVSAPASGGANVAQAATRAGTEQVSVKFSPALDGAGPLDRVGTGMVSKLKDLEASRASRSQAMKNVHAGPANPVDIAKSELLGGPASQSLSVSSNSAPGMSASHSDHAMAAMTRTFDYAIETQLIVKTGSQISTSASSLMRGQ